MKLTTHTDYALRVMIYLALSPARLATIREIAERYGISRNHVMKIVRELGHAGFVKTVRGKNGGIRLGRPADTIGVGALVRTMEDNMNVVDCFDPTSRACQIMPACVLKGVLEDAVDAFLAVLDGYTLADLIAPENDLAHLVQLRTGTG